MRDESHLAASVGESEGPQSSGERLEYVIGEDWQYFVCELFVNVVERCPDALEGPWGVLLAVLKADPRYWLDVDEPDAARVPNLAKLHAVWPQLLERVWHAI